jgi:CheY-like chemotaxis protein
MARIFVIDDDRAVGMAMRIALEREGFSVEVVNDGRAGIERSKSEEFDLLIVDIFMPGMDGIETIRLVREHRPQIPILVMSGMTFRSGTAPAPDFLRPRELLAVIAECREGSIHGPKPGTPESAVSPGAGSNS